MVTTDPPIHIRHAESDPDVASCFPVMVLLRPHLHDANELVARVARQRSAGYWLLAAWRGETVAGLAGYRATENLIHGRFLYVDDLVTAEAERSLGLGARLLDAVEDEGRKLGCGLLVLDTAIDNISAQRFYSREHMSKRAVRFSRPIEKP